MASLSVLDNRPHAVCIPFPAQGHINPMTKVAKLLHYKGFHITFVHTEFNYNRLLKSRGLSALDGLQDFRFEKIPDGLPPMDADCTQEIPSLCDSTSKTCLAPFRELLVKLNDTSSSNVPPVTCIVSDGIMSFTIDAAEELGVPVVLFWTASACGFLGYTHFEQLTQRGYTQFNDETNTNEYLDTVLDWIPGMKDIRLRDIPSFIRTTNPDDIMLNFFLREIKRAHRASAIFLNTFHALERNALDALSSIFEKKVYSIGPLQLLLNQISQEFYSSIGSNLWREDETKSLFQWLNSKKPNSIIYVNFGSIAVMTPSQFTEFAWGLANSNQNFLWIIRPDLIIGDSAILQPEFIQEIKDRGLVLSWCPQEQVLNHPSVGCFLTHSGWNSTLESICSGVPMICWPFFAEQFTNCRYTCREWGIGMEINSDVKRREIENLVKEMMEGEKGVEMKKNIMDWKKMAEEATMHGGVSFLNLEKMVKDVLITPVRP